jgi:hypothetical protein
MQQQHHTAGAAFGHYGLSVPRSDGCCAVERINAFQLVFERMPFGDNGSSAATQQQATEIGVAVSC